MNRFLIYATLSLSFANALNCTRMVGEYGPRLVINPRKRLTLLGIRTSYSPGIKPDTLRAAILRSFPKGYHLLFLHLPLYLARNLLVCTH